MNKEVIDQIKNSHKNASLHRKKEGFYFKEILAIYLKKLSFEKLLISLAAKTVIV